MGRFEPRDSESSSPRMAGTGRPLYSVLTVFGVNDGALFAKLRDQRLVSRREIDVVVGIGAASAAHVFGVVGILEREYDAVHGQFREVGIPAVLRIEFGGALERIRLLAEFLADGGRAGRQRAVRGTAGHDRPCR